MQTVTIRLDSLEKVKIPLGFVGENLHRRVIFVCDSMFKQYPSAVAALAIVNPAGVMYPGILTREGNNVLWDIRDSDVAVEGNGEIQLTFTEDTHVAKEYKCKTHITESIVPNSPAPDPVQDWLDYASGLIDGIPDDIAAALAEAKASGEFDGVGIASIAKTGTSGLVDTYTITLDNGGSYDFTVTNGQKGDDGVGIQSIAKTSTSGLVDTYTITLTNGQTSEFTVTNGRDGVQIDDTTPDSNKVFSSAKVAEMNTQLLNHIDGKTTQINNLEIATKPEYISQFKNRHSGLSAESKTIIVKQDETFTNSPWVFLGKNYLPEMLYFSQNECRFAAMSITSDGSKLHVKGTAGSENAFYVMQSKGGTRFFPIPDGMSAGDKFDLYIFTKKNTTLRTPAVRIYIYDTNKSQIGFRQLRVDANSTYARTINFEIPSGAVYMSVGIEWANAEEHDNIFVPVLVKSGTVILNDHSFENGYTTYETDNTTTEICSAPYTCEIQNNVPIKKYIDWNDEKGAIDNIVTPEMFGAYGDGAKNDIDCLQACINYAYANGKTVIGGGSYNISKPLTITGNYQKIKLRKITYFWADCAVIVSGMFNDIDIGSIEATYGACFRLFSSIETSYNKIHIGRAYAAKNCIELIHNANHLICNNISFEYLHCGTDYASVYQGDENAGASTFMNNNNFIGGRLSGGKWGVNGARGEDTYMTCMFEDTNSCIKAAGTGIIRIISPRYVEVNQHSLDGVQDKGLIFKRSVAYGIQPNNDAPDYQFYIEAPSSYVFATNFDITSVPGTRYNSNNVEEPIKKDSPPPSCVYVELQNRAGQIVAPYFMTFCNHILIKEPYRKRTKHIKDTDAGYQGDYHTTNNDMEFDIFERYIIDDADCEYILPPSYDNIAFNKFYVEQSSGSYVTFKDWRGTTVFDGQTYGDGVYEVTITVQNNSDNYYNNYQIWEVRRISTGELIDTMPHSP